MGHLGHMSHVRGVVVGILGRIGMHSLLRHVHFSLLRGAAVVPRGLVHFETDLLAGVLFLALAESHENDIIFLGLLLDTRFKALLVRVVVVLVVLTHF